MRGVLFKPANTPDEFRQIHELNHRVFAEEIAQHPTNASRSLVDPFHGQNHYFVCLRNQSVVGMISAHPGPEFSIAKRLPDRDLLRQLPRPLEVRLLAIDPAERNGTLLAGLFWQVYEFAVSNGFSHILASGIAEREPMYRRLGFQALGCAVREGSANFVPMVKPLKAGERTANRLARLHEDRWNRTRARPSVISLLPGPVCIHPKVAEAFAAPPVSHRSSAFVDRFETAKCLLKRLLGGGGVALFPGGGTLANDAVAANLRAIFGDAPGLILTNGEFGDRLTNQARRAGLRFSQLEFAAGGPWCFERVSQALTARPAWIWAVQVETSTGVLNDIGTLLELARRNGCAVALDCVSSVGAVKIAAHEGPLFLASGVSGKSLGSYTGLSFVSLSDECKSRLSGALLPPSFDLCKMQTESGPLTTVSSPLLSALACALEYYYGSTEAAESRFQQYALLGQQTRSLMRMAGLQPLASEAVAAPNITTFALPDAEFPHRCLAAGYEIAYLSAYLKLRGWGQIASMGDIAVSALEPLFAAVSPAP